MTDQGSNLCTPVKESEVSKVVQNKDTVDEIEGQSEVVNTDEVRLSVRERIPTEKMLAYQREEVEKAERKLMHAYEKWKAEARKARGQLKTDIPESQLASLIDTLENERDNVMNAYIKVRSYATPPTDSRRRIDACDAVTKDIVKIAYERISGVDGDFDSEGVRRRLRELLDRDDVRSVYGSTVSRINSKSSTPTSQPSLNSILMAKRIEAAAELAAKEAEHATIMEERELREKIQLLEEKQKKELDTQKSEFERLQAIKEVRAARARLEVYDKEETIHSANQNDELQQPVSVPSHKPVYSSSVKPTLNERVSSPTPNADVSYLAQAVQDSITLNRLSVPEPTIFKGDPIHFIEWKASFQSLIDKRHISSADKLYYLKKYVAGSALKTLEGMFYRTDEEAYKDAWKRLQDRYGQPFIIQRAFREKLASWPRIQPKDSEGLRNFSDFLNSCRDAMPHVKGLEILNDCEENRKLVSKLPDWAAACWNRQATQTLSETQDFPTFQDFAHFMSIEAEVACNPITSFHALHVSEANKEKHNFKLGHSARDCRSRHSCNTCKGRHPTCLHDDSFIRKVKSFSVQGSENPHEKVVTVSLSVESGCMSANTSMIVPVWLSSQNDPVFEKLVYALLDTQSDTVFTEYAVSQNLKVDSSPVTLRHTTMVGKDSLITSERVSGLRVRGFNSTVVLELPPAYTKDCIPVDRAHIPTTETASCWKHLAPLIDRIPPLQDCEVGLLIGYNCSRALAPREVILGTDNEPYAVRTDLGWSIVGPSLTHHESQSCVTMCHRVSIKEIPVVKPTDVIKVLESDFKDTEQNTRVVSQEDIMFLNKLGENIRMNQDSHLEMPLPFKKRPCLPDNEPLAIMRLQHLKRRLMKIRSSSYVVVQYGQ
ncbi:Ribosomal RNA large subunit methyltransferase K/L [Labeo rohita]|uniref:Ribosomal RNA large subunit methyltransferase K/L n=1 Tax=Labeo rohita TaxID=84645 RepID=A0ABQ8LHV3_LABRO|nr:Ribosomal RNA large subunit methyltransferase K/L [Labeo rohita]